ncbi:hypothetical protein AHAS_Ahas02G0209700 [Arachis hypogaea]
MEGGENILDIINNDYDDGDDVEMVDVEEGELVEPDSRNSLGQSEAGGINKANEDSHNKDHRLRDGDSSKLAIATNLSGKERSKGIKGVAGPSQKASRLKSTYSEKKHVLERPANILTSFDQNDKRTQAPELQMSIVPKDFCFDELESVVKIKQAEAKMFQSRADDARREAEGLKRIALEKSEKIDEEYTQRIAKLRLGETKEMRRQKLEKLQALERANLEYFNMKRRMEADPIKDLLSNMETTKRSLAL